jgi:hypothetical protein
MFDKVSVWASGSASCSFILTRGGDPAMFVTAIPSWNVGDEFLAGSDLVKFRILDVDTEQTPGGAHGAFTVETVGE